MRFRLVCPCLFGLERFLADEIDALGYEPDTVQDGRVIFTGDEEAVARCNIGLRTAERVLILLGEFEARTFDQLFEGVRALPLEDFIGREDAFPVKGSSLNSLLKSIPDCQAIIKKAAAVRLGDHYGLPRMPETGALMQLQFTIFKDRCSLMLDTSGQPLYKRGYRQQTNAAPLRETLAAAMVMLARPVPDHLFWDPFCGSGTLPIEAAMQMMHIAPGMKRHFAAEAYAFLPSCVWQDARTEAADEVDPGKFMINASDIDPACIQMTRCNAKAAGVDFRLRTFVSDVRQIRKTASSGVFVCNPPYGERLMDPREVKRLYTDFGNVFRQFEDYRLYLLTSYRDFETDFACPADKRRKVYNGMLRADIYQYYKHTIATKGERKL